MKKKTKLTKRDALERMVGGITWLDQETGVCHFPCMESQSPCESWVLFNGNARIACVNERCANYGKITGLNNELLEEMAGLMTNGTPRMYLLQKI